MKLSPKISWLTAMLILAPFAATVEGASPPVDLGTLGGTFSQANAVNLTQFIVVGSASLSGDSNTHAFRGVGQQPLQDLGTLPLDPTTPTGNSIANAVMLLGGVAGTSDIDITDQFGDLNRYQHAFLYTKGAMGDLGTLGGSQSFGNAAAGLGSYVVVAGAAYLNGDAATHAFLWSASNSTMTDLGTLSGGTNSAALAVSGSGTVGGNSDSSDGTTHAVTWVGTTIKDLGTLGGSFATVTAVNDYGVPVGFGFLAGDEVARAFVGTSLAKLGNLGGSQTQANAINDLEVVVGSSNTKGDADVHAFYWTKKSGMVDLNTLLPTGSPWDLQSATSIALDGTVVGVGTINGESHAFKMALGVL